MLIRKIIQWPKKINGIPLRLTNLLSTSSDESTTSFSILAKRFRITTEVTISKIFPGGFGWQYFSVLAAQHGYQGADTMFAVYTGFGDFTGVFLGHSIYYTVKKIIDPSINIQAEIGTGFFLGSAAFCSGFMWQPTVNFLQSMSQPFIGVASGTWLVCGLAFFGGLRLFRAIYSPLSIVVPNNNDNLILDAQLSVSVGGAAGAFVGTDVAYLNGEGNFLRSLVGVEPTDTALIGCTKAGSATGLGLFVAQCVQNIVQPSKSKNWTD